MNAGAFFLALSAVLLTQLQLLSTKQCALYLAKFLFKSCVICLFTPHPLAHQVMLKHRSCSPSFRIRSTIVQILFCLLFLLFRDFLFEIDARCDVEQSVCIVKCNFFAKSPFPSTLLIAAIIATATHFQAEGCVKHCSISFNSLTTPAAEGLSLGFSSQHFCLQRKRERIMAALMNSAQLITLVLHIFCRKH